MLLRSDGFVVVCGNNRYGQRSIPRLDEGVSYAHVSAGGLHTTLLRSDGRAVACGGNFYGECIAPSPQAGTFYVCPTLQGRDLVLQLDPVREENEVRLTFSGLTGEEVLCLSLLRSDLAWDAHRRIARKLNVCLPSLRVVLPDGQLLASVCRAHPGATLADVIGDLKRSKRLCLR